MAKKGKEKGSGSQAFSRESKDSEDSNSVNGQTGLVTGQTNLVRGQASGAQAPDTASAKGQQRDKEQSGDLSPFRVALANLPNPREITHSSLSSKERMASKAQGHQGEQYTWPPVSQPSKPPVTSLKHLGSKKKGKKGRQKDALRLKNRQALAKTRAEWEALGRHSSELDIDSFDAWLDDLERNGYVTPPSDWSSDSFDRTPSVPPLAVSAPPRALAQPLQTAPSGSKRPSPTVPVVESMAVKGLVFGDGLRSNPPPGKPAGTVALPTSQEAGSPLPRLSEDKSQDNAVPAMAISMSDCESLEDLLREDDPPEPEPVTVAARSQERQPNTSQVPTGWEEEEVQDRDNPNRRAERGERRNRSRDRGKVGYSSPRHRQGRRISPRRRSPSRSPRRSRRSRSSDRRRLYRRSRSRSVDRFPRRSTSQRSPSRDYERRSTTRRRSHSRSSDRSVRRARAREDNRHSARTRSLDYKQPYTTQGYRERQRSQMSPTRRVELVDANTPAATRPTGSGQAPWVSDELGRRAGREQDYFLDTQTPVKALNMQIEDSEGDESETGDKDIDDNFILPEDSFIQLADTAKVATRHGRSGDSASTSSSDDGHRRKRRRRKSHSPRRKRRKHKRHRHRHYESDSSSTSSSSSSSSGYSTDRQARKHKDRSLEAAFDVELRQQNTAGVQGMYLSNAGNKRFCDMGIPSKGRHTSEGYRDPLRLKDFHPESIAKFIVAIQMRYDLAKDTHKKLTKTQKRELQNIKKFFTHQQAQSMMWFGLRDNGYTDWAEVPGLIVYRMLLALHDQWTMGTARTPDAVTAALRAMSFSFPYKTEKNPMHRVAVDFVNWVVQFNEVPHALWRVKEQYIAFGPVNFWGLHSLLTV